MDLSRIPRGQLITAGAGVALLFAMLALDWFSIRGNPEGFNAFQAFGFEDIVLLVTAVIAIELVLIAGAAKGRGKRMAASGITGLLGVVAAILIAYRIISPPDLLPGGFIGEHPREITANVKREIGLYAGLVASAMIAAGGFLSRSEEAASYRTSGDDH